MNIKIAIFLIGVVVFSLGCTSTDNGISSKCEDLSCVNNAIKTCGVIEGDKDSYNSERTIVYTSKRTIDEFSDETRQITSIAFVRPKGSNKCIVLMTLVMTDISSPSPPRASSRISCELTDYASVTSVEELITEKYSSQCKCDGGPYRDDCPY